MKDVGQELLEVFALAADVAPLRAALEDVALLLEDEHVVAVALDVRHPDVHDVAQLNVWRVVGCGDRAHLIEQGLHELVADEHQQAVLAADVVIQAAGGEPGRCDQVLHRGGVEPLHREHTRCRSDDLLLTAVVARAQGWTGRWSGHRAHDASATSRCVRRPAS